MSLRVFLLVWFALCISLPAQISSESFEQNVPPEEASQVVSPGVVACLHFPLSCHALLEEMRTAESAQTSARAAFQERTRMCEKTQQWPPLTRSATADGICALLQPS